MNLIINNLQIPIEKDGNKAYLAAASQQLEIGEEQFSVVKIISKALDLKNSEQFYYTLSLVVTVPDNYANRQNFAAYSEAADQTIKNATNKTKNAETRPIIVGFGPAGMFAALELIRAGLKPLIFERGKKIEERSLDVENFIKERTLNPESNIQFGEGGAGSFSDGKLFSRRNNNSAIVSQVLKTFVQFGAPPEIVYISKPHLGTDVLCKIVRNIRLYILDHGGRIYYESKMTDILISSGAAAGIIINEEQEFISSAIYIALGHSARDTFTMLHAKGVAIEQRNISVGVRIEHPARVINLMRFGKKYHTFPELGAATYSLNHTNRIIKKSVYTFCMCPGGEIVNAASTPGELVLNGMSYSDRASPFSNGALVVGCHTEDYGSDNPLAGLAFQEKIERAAFRAGGSNWAAPAQNLTDFLARKNSAELKENSYKMGVVSAEMRDIFPKFITSELEVAFRKWQDDVPLFVSHHALLLGAETRMSSPIRIIRNKQYESVNIKNLYPIGEGAGYTGGITSSAADAIKAVQAHLLQ